VTDLYSPNTAIWVPVERLRKKLREAGANPETSSALIEGQVDRRHLKARSYDLTVRARNMGGTWEDYSINNVSAKVIRPAKWCARDPHRRLWKRAFAP